MKRNLTSLVMSIISIVVYAIITTFLVFLVIEAIKNNQGNEQKIKIAIGVVLVLFSIFGTIGYGVATFFGLLALIFAVIANPKKTSRIVLSIIFLVLPYLTEIISIIVLQSFNAS